MPWEEQPVFNIHSKTYEQVGINSAAVWWTAAAGLIMFVIILPLWLVQYVPLYDYQNHLLEAQVVVHYEDPQMDYSSSYEVRKGWYLRSNALTTIMMTALGQIIPMETAGKAILTLYVLVLGSGLLALLHALKSPYGLVLFLPVLIFNFTFTTGMLNWSFGFALVPWAIYTYLLWQQRKALSLIVVLAILLLLIYVAHLLAWGLVLAILFTIGVVEGISRKDAGLLLLASTSAAPMLLFTRPILALAPFLIFFGMWMLRALFIRLRLSALKTVVLGCAGISIFLVGVKIFQHRIQQVFPDVGYSSYSKTVSFFQTFVLPHHYGSDDDWLIPLNLLILGFILLTLMVLAVESGKVYRRFGLDNWKWLAAGFLLVIGYFVIPTRTHDIIVTEPRVLLFIFFIGLMVVKNPLPDSKLGRLLVPLIAVTAGISLFSIWYYSFRYDTAAQSWARQLGEIPAGERLLVLSDPLPDDVNHPLKIGQIFDQHQFANTYALELGGFTSNTFFNGPLLPVNPASIPPYWWIEFRPGPYVDRLCERLKPEYDYVLLWNPRSEDLLQSLSGCYGEPYQRLEDLWLWTSNGE